MNIEQILSIVEINRESITRNTSSAIAELRDIKTDFKDEASELYLLSIALNSSLVEMLFYSNHVKAIEISERAISQFSQAGTPYLVAYHHRVIGRCMAFIGKHESSRIHLENALEVIDKAPNTSGLITLLKGDVLHDMAMQNNFAGGNPERSIELLQLAIRTLDGREFEVRRAVCQMAIGIVMYEQERVQESLDSYLLSAEVFENHYILKNLGCVFNNIGLCYLKLEDFAKSESYLKRSLELRFKAGSPDEISNVYFGFALLYSEQGNQDLAYSNLERCLEYSTLSKNQVMLEQTLRFMNDIDEFRNSSTAQPDTQMRELAA